MIDTMKKMNTGDGYSEEKELCCPECGHRASMDDFESDESKGASEGAGLNPKAGKSAARDAISRAMMESGASEGMEG